jgi:Mg2+ and Co2+ transporter CorA
VLEGPTAAERRVWLERIGLRGELVEVAMDTGETSRALIRDDFTLFELPGTSSTQEPRSVQACFVCFVRLVLVITEGPVCGIEQVFSSTWAETRRRQGGTSFVVAATLVFMGAALRAMVASVKATVSSAAKQMDVEPESVSLAEIGRLKAMLLDADTIVEETMATLELVQVTQRPQLDLVTQAELLTSALGHVTASERRLDRLEHTIDHLQDRHDASQQEKTNRRLGVLTALSAIFMPLTLLVGIWGMNFDLMPELHLPWGYPAALLVLAAIALGMYRWFYSHGWLY